MVILTTKKTNNSHYYCFIFKGSFYSGDSYIILNTYKEEEVKKKHFVHETKIVLILFLGDKI